MEYIHHYQSPLGGITLASDGIALSGLWFDGQKYFADTLEDEHVEESLPVFDEACRWLDTYFDGRIPDFTLPLAMKDTPFRKAVWEILLSVPYGETITYKEIADKIAKQKGLAHMSPQAIGGAVGHNAISLVIPCHRVVGSDGSLTGYAGGLDRKKALLRMEKRGRDLEIAIEMLSGSEEFSCVLCKDAQTVSSKEHGVRPLMAWIGDARDFAGYSVADTVVGKAAALLYIKLGAAQIYAKVISESALTVLQEHKIPVSYGQKVAYIVNRTGDDMCPMEKAVAQIADPDQAVIALRDCIDAMRRASGS